MPLLEGIFYQGPNPASAALLMTSLLQLYCHGNACQFFAMFLVIKITEDVTISLNEYCQMWYVRSMSNWSTIVKVHIFCKQAIHSYNREKNIAHKFFDNSHSYSQLFKMNKI